MATIFAHGQELTFPMVDYNLLAAYGIGRDTYYLAYRPQDATDEYLITSQVLTLQRLGVADRVQPIILPQGRRGILFDYIADGVTSSHLSTLRLYLSQICTTNWMLICPYHEKIQQLQRDVWEQEQFLLDYCLSAPQRVKSHPQTKEIIEELTDALYNRPQTTQAVIGSGYAARAASTTSHPIDDTPMSRPAGAQPRQTPAMVSASVQPPFSNPGGYAANYNCGGYAAPSNGGGYAANSDPGGYAANNNNGGYAANEEGETNQDTSDLGAETNQDTSDLRAETNQDTSDLRTETNQDTSDLRTETHPDTSDLRTETHPDTSDLRTESHYVPGGFAANNKWGGYAAPSNGGGYAANSNPGGYAANNNNGGYAANDEADTHHGLGNPTSETGQDRPQGRPIHRVRKRDPISDPCRLRRYNHRRLEL